MTRKKREWEWEGVAALREAFKIVFVFRIGKYKIFCVSTRKDQVEGVMLRL